MYIFMIYDMVVQKHVREEIILIYDISGWFS